jgi:hypothetical protein
MSTVTIPSTIQHEPTLYGQTVVKIHIEGAGRPAR